MGRERVVRRMVRSTTSARSVVVAAADMVEAVVAPKTLVAAAAAAQARPDPSLTFRPHPPVPAVRVPVEESVDIRVLPVEMARS
jgi:hypothetical protein